MVDKPSDNRRRISDNLLDEIEEFDGKDFSEQLLKWKNSSDELSQLIEDTEKSLEQAANGQTLSNETQIRERIEEIRNNQDNMSNQVAEEVEKTIKSLESIGKSDGKTVEELKENLELDNMSNDIDYTHIESLIEKHTDRVIKKLGR